MNPEHGKVVPVYINESNQAYWVEDNIQAKYPVFHYLNKPFNVPCYQLAMFDSIGRYMIFSDYIEQQAKTFKALSEIVPGVEYDTYKYYEIKLDAQGKIIDLVQYDEQVPVSNKEYKTLTVELYSKFKLEHTLELERQLDDNGVCIYTNGFSYYKRLLDPYTPPLQSLAKGEMYIAEAYTERLPFPILKFIIRLVIFYRYNGYRPYIPDVLYRATVEYYNTTVPDPVTAKNAWVGTYNTYYIGGDSAQEFEPDKEIYSAPYHYQDSYLLVSGKGVSVCPQ